MEQTTKPPRSGFSLSRTLSTRRGALMVAGIAALLAAVALIAYLAHYRDQVRGGTVPAQVLVADRLIPKGTSGEAIATGRFFKVITLTADDVDPQALADATTLAGQTTARDIQPGQQLLSSDFSDGGDPVRGMLVGSDRGLALPLDAAHGMIGDIRAGDRVDVIGSFPDDGIARVLVQDVLVLKAPSEAPDQTTDKRTILLRLSDEDATAVALTADDADVWVALRPPAGANQHPTEPVTKSSIIAGR